MAETYDSTFTALKVAVEHLEEGDRYGDLVDRVQQQIEETGELEDDMIAPFLEMLYDLYDDAKTFETGVKDLRKTVEQKARAEEQRGTKNPYLKKRGADAEHRRSQTEIEADKDTYEKELEETAYQQDLDAVLGAMEFLSDIVDDPEVTYEQMQEEAEEYHERH